MKLQGKKAVITGGASGIGQGCAMALAAAGADVALNDRSDGPGLQAVLADIRRLGRQAVGVPGDAFDRAECERIVAAAVEGLGQIDILVSSPAYTARAPFLDFDPQKFEAVLRGTLVAGFHISQLVARHMVDRGAGGKIVFISSVQARIPYTRSVAYNAAKAGLNNMAYTIANELLPHRINVNCIEPGWIDTPGERAAFGDEAIARDGPQLPWGRLGTAADVGNAAAFLASEEAAYVTGTTLVVDGGLWLKAARA
ncbi:MAG TPA: SDR family oxidoreductase [Pirellulales bacterium]